MVSMSIRHVFLCLFTVTLITGVISPTLYSDQNEKSHYINIENSFHENGYSNLDFAILQENTTTTETTNETTTETTQTTTTTSQEFAAWTPLIEPSLYYPLALIFSVLGIFSTIWMIFFVETSKERTLRERLIGTTIRLIVMAICVGIAIHFWVLFEPI
jgi:hypothetical protein